MCCVTKDGYIKRSSIKSYQASVKNGIKEGDAVIYSGMVNTLDTLLQELRAQEEALKNQTSTSAQDTNLLNAG